MTPNTRNWSAWIDLQPPGPPALHVIGEVEVSASNKRPVLREASPQGINPEILLLDLSIQDTGGIGTPAFEYKEVRFDKSPVRARQYSTVQIRWEGNDIESVNVGETQ